MANDLRKILYASGVEGRKDEEAIAKNQDDDERMLNRILRDMSWAATNYKDRDLEFDRCEHWYFRDHYDSQTLVTGDISANTPKDYSSNIEDEYLVTLNIPFSSVQRAHTMMTGENPIIEVLKSGDRGERVSKLLHGVMQINTHRWGTNPMHAAIFDQLLYGWGCISTTWNRNDWADEDTQFQGDRPLYEFPISVRAIPPKEIYPIPGGSLERWKAVIHRSYMKVFEVEDEWGVELHMNDEDNYEADENFDYTEPLDPSQEVEVLDYWCWQGTQIVHAVVAHNQFVMVPAVMKFYDSLPFTIFFCGTTTSDNPKNYGLSINYALIDTVSNMEWLTNRMMRVADLYADPTLVITRMNDDMIQTDPASKVIDLVEGESARYLSHQGSLPELDNLLGFFRSMADEEGFGTIAGASGIDTIAQQQNAMIKIFKPVENAQSAWEDINRKIIGLLQRFSWDTSIEVAGRLDGEESQQAFNFTMKGSDTKGCRDTKVRLRARFPLEELRNITAAATAKNAELIPVDVIRKRLLGAQDVAEWDRKILEERIKNSPEALGPIIQSRLRLIEQQSTVQSLVQQELQKAQQPNQVTERQSVGTQGAPENPAPTPLSPSAPSPESLIQQTINSSGVGIPDNGAPTSQPTPQPGGLNG